MTKKKFQWVRVTQHSSSVEKREIHSHAIFFSSNQLRVKFFSKNLISRNFCENIVAVKFRNFPTVWNLHMKVILYKIFKMHSCTHITNCVIKIQVEMMLKWLTRKYIYITYMSKLWKKVSKILWRRKNFAQYIFHNLF